MSKHRDLLSPLRAAIDDYAMIQPHDHVAVGVSGGKDSVALLTLLARLQRFYPYPFSLTAITLDPRFDGETDYSSVAALCEQLNVPYVVKRTQLWETVVQESGDEKPCSRCARMRRGMLHRTAVEAGCNVVALGHHQDDAAETLLMNLLSGATCECFSPKSELDRREITLIRPLIYIKEKELAAFVKREGLPVVASRCPVDGCTARGDMKDLIKQLSATYGDVNHKLTAALKKGHISRW